MTNSAQPRILTCLIKLQADAYMVNLLNEEQQLESPPYRFDWDPDERLTATLAMLSKDTLPEDSSTKLIELGQALYQALFGGAGHPVLQRLDKGWANKQPLRLQIYAQAPELERLPWEALHDGINLLSARSEVTLVRIVDSVRQIERIRVSGPLRILFMSAAPENLEGLQTEQTANKLRELLGPQIKQGRVALDILHQATIPELQEALLRNYHVFCFAGHGNTDALYLDDGQGDWDVAQGVRSNGDAQPISSAELALLLEGKDTQLVMLMACRTSAFLDEAQKPIVGFAENLVRQANLPAVIAMQTPISDLQAHPFAAHFFASLGAHHPIDVAVAEARKVLAHQGRFGRDVIAPVLWLQARDSKLFQRAIDVRSIVLAVLVGLLFVLAGLALNHVTSENYARLLAYQAERELDGPFPERSIPLALLARREQPDLPEIEQSLYRAVISSRGRQLFPGLAPSYSPDGTRILHYAVDPLALDPLSEDQAEDLKAIRIISAATGKQEGFFSLENGLYDTAIFRPDGKQIAATDGNSVAVWSLASNILVFRLAVDSPQDIAYSPDSKALLVATKRAVSLWDAESKRLLLTVDSPGEDFSKVAYHPRVAQFTTLGNEGTLRQWSAVDGTPLRTWQVHSKQPVFGTPLLLYNPDGRSLLTAGDTQDSEVTQLWDAATGQRIATLGGYNGRLTSASYSGDGRRLAISTESEVKIWDLQSQQPIATVRGHRFLRFGMSPAGVIHTSLSPDGTQLLTSGYDGTVRVWEVDPTQEPVELENASSRTFVFSPDGTTIAAYNGYHSVHIWQTGTGALLRSIPAGINIEALAFSPDGRRLATTRRYSDQATDATRVWEIATGREVFHTPFGGERIIFNPDGRTLLLSDYFEGTIIDATTGKYLFPATGSITGRPRFTPNGDAIITIDDSSLFFALKTSVGQSFSFPTDHNHIQDFALSSDSQTVVTIGDGLIKVWDGGSRKKLREIDIGATSALPTGGCVALSSDGRRVATSVGSQVKLWSTETGLLLVRLNRPHTTLGCLAFSSDGAWLAAASSDNVIQVWPVWSEPVSLERYASDCCLVRPLDNYDFEQLTAIQPNLLRSLAGKLTPLVFIPCFVALYALCWILLRGAVRWGKPPTQLEAQTTRWQRLRRAASRRLFLVLGCGVIFGWIAGLFMGVDPLEDYGAAPLLLALIPASFTGGVAYYLLYRQRVLYAAWVRLPLGALFWNGIGALVGCTFATLISSFTWATPDQLVLGLFSDLWLSIVTQPTELDQTMVLVLFSGLFGLFWALFFCMASLVGLVLATLLQRLDLWRHRFNRAADL